MDAYSLPDLAYDYGALERTLAFNISGRRPPPHPLDRPVTRRSRKPHGELAAPIDEQLELIDILAEQVQALGGVAVGDPRHAAEITGVPRPPNGCEPVPAMLARLLDAHELVIEELRAGIARTNANGDAGTNDLLMSDVLRRHEMPVWFLAEHLVDTPVAGAANGR